MEITSTQFDMTNPFAPPQQRMKQFNKLQRQMIRRVLPRQKAMRGARAR